MAAMLLLASTAVAQEGKISRAVHEKFLERSRVPVFIVLTGQPQQGILAKYALEAARDASARRPVDAEAHALGWRQRAHEEIARQLAPQQDRIEGRLRTRGADRFGRYNATNTITAEIPYEALESLQNDPDVAQVFLASMRSGLLVTSVPALGTTAFWNAGFTGAGQDVALVDSGVRSNHPAFAGLAMQSRTFLTFARSSPCFDDDSSTTEDKQGHGTHIAGILASRGSTGFSNYFGVARGVTTLHNLKAAFRSKPAQASCGNGTAEADDRDLLDAVGWASTQTTSKVINLSFGSTTTDDDDFFSQQIDATIDLNDAFLAVAAGNSGPAANTVGSPGLAYNAMSVGNWSSRGSMSSTSSRGPTVGGRFKPDIAAPGSFIVSTAWDWDITGQPDFFTSSGTSMAAPHIAGAAVLLRQAGVTQPLEMKAILLNTTGETNWVADRGWGYANLTTAAAQYTTRDSNSIDPNTYKFYRIASPGTFTATLTWNRHVSATSIRFNNLDLTGFDQATGNVLADSSSTLQNVEKVSLQTSSPAILKVRSAASDTALDFFGIAFTSGAARVTGPVLSVSCSQPSSASSGATFTGSCTATNSGGLTAFNTFIQITTPSGGLFSWTLGNIAAGSSATTSTSLTVTASGTQTFSVLARSVSYGETIDATSSFSVTFGTGLPAPANPNPANNATGVAQAGTLSWSASSGATAYDVYFSASNPPVLFQTGLTSTSMAFSGLTPGVTYFWRVVARNASTSSSSEIWRFTTGASTGLLFVPITPCRLVDTRNAAGSLGGPALPAKTARTFPLRSHSCLSGSNALAYSLNITVVPQGPLGFLTVWPAGQSQPVVSTLNALDGRVKANAAMVPAGTNGDVTLYATDATHAVIDVNGYFVTAGTTGGLVYYPVTPCRVADTRSGQGPALSGGVARTFSVTGSGCSIPSTAQAFALNATVVPQTSSFGFLTLWPAGLTQPLVSTLNAVTGTVTANAAIVPAGTGANAGSITAFGTDNAHLVLDINGYFAPAGNVGALTFHPITPCRVLDTRNAAGPAGGPILSANVSREIQVHFNGACPAVSSASRAYSLNATVVPPSAFGFLTMWPAGLTRPTVSTLNALDGAITSNAAIVVSPSPGGAISVLGSDVTHLLLDINGYFAP